MDVNQALSFDVLVLGGSGAAVMSDIAAMRKGQRVAIVSKGKIGRSGNAIMIGGGFGTDGRSAHDVCGEVQANRNYTAEQLYTSIIKGSFYLSDQELVRQYTQKGPYGIQECLGWVRNAKAKFFFIPPASLWNTSGKHFGFCLKQSMVDNPGAQIFEDTVAVDLLQGADGSVCGVTAVQVYTGEIIELRAKSVILATGGIQPFSLKSSISDMTGDGVAMALRAGAMVSDMEYYLFIPTALEPSYLKGSIIPYLMTLPVNFTLRPKVTDLDGVPLEIDEKYRCIPATHKMNKIMYAYFWGKGIYEKIAAHGNAMYFDFSDYSAEEIKGAFEFFAQQASKWYPKGFYNGINLYELCEYILKNGKRLKVGLGNEYSQGGVVVDKNLFTGVPGLFAAGEVTAGVFGAFRSADGITEMLAHGIDAGKNAAEYAAGAPLVDPVNAEENKALLLEPLERVEGPSPYKLIEKIEGICDRGLNFFRCQRSIDAAIEELGEIKKCLPLQAGSCSNPRYNLEWLGSITARNLLLCAEAGLHAASMRKESRGTHMRCDHPCTDNQNFLYNIVSKLENGQLTYRQVKPRVVDIPLPTENFPSIPDYILSTMEG